MKTEIELCNGKTVELGFMADSVLTSDTFVLPASYVNNLVEVIFDADYCGPYKNTYLIPEVFEKLRVANLLKRLADELSKRSGKIGFRGAVNMDVWYQTYLAGLWKDDDGGEIFWPLLEAYVFSDTDYSCKPPFQGLEFIYRLSEVVSTENLKPLSKIVFSRQKKMYGHDHLEKRILSAESPHFVSFCHRIVRQIDVSRYTHKDWQAFERLLEFLCELSQKIGENRVWGGPFSTEVLRDILKIRERMESKDLQLAASDAREHLFADAKNLGVLQAFSSGHLVK